MKKQRARELLLAPPLVLECVSVCQTHSHASTHLPHEMIPPRPHNRKYLLDPNSHESPPAGAPAPAAASHWATVNGPLNGDERAASYNELNIFVLLLLLACLPRERILRFPCVLSV